MEVKKVSKSLPATSKSKSLKGGNTFWENHDQSITIV